MASHALWTFQRGPQPGISSIPPHPRCQQALPGERRGTRLATRKQVTHPSGTLLPHSTACPPASASPPRTRGAGQGRARILAAEGRGGGRCEAAEWKRRAARMGPGAAAGGGCRRYRWHGAGPGRTQTLGTFLPDGTITHWSCLPGRPHHEWKRSHKILLSLE